MLARDYLHQNATPGECIAVTHAIFGMNFWGPPLVPVDLPASGKPFAMATREALRRTPGPRYRLRVLDRGAPEQLEDCDWVVTPRLDIRRSIELGGPAADPEKTVPAGFAVATVIRGLPEPQSGVWPYPVSLDYDELRKHSMLSLWRARVCGQTLVIYRKVPGSASLAARPRTPS